MDPNFTEILAYIEGTASSLPEGDEAPSPYFYWPPGVLQEAIPEDEPATCEESDEARRLSRTFHVIERQNSQIQELKNSVELWKDIELHTLQNFSRFKRRCRRAIQAVAALLLLVALLLWHEAISTVGWNLLHGIARFFGTGPEFLSGLLVAAIVLRLMWTMDKGVFQAAKEDLFPDKGEETPTDEEDDFL